MLTDPPWKVKVRKTMPCVNAIILQPYVHGKEVQHLPREKLNLLTDPHGEWRWGRVGLVWIPSSSSPEWRGPGSQQLDIGIHRCWLHSHLFLDNSIAIAVLIYWAFCLNTNTCCIFALVISSINVTLKRNRSVRLQIVWKYNAIAQVWRFGLPHQLLHHTVVLL
jgi:hypothetical protein